MNVSTDNNPLTKKPIVTVELSRKKTIARFKKIKQLPSLPEITHKLNAAFENTDTSAEEIANLLQFDPAISAAILKIVNSVYFNPTQNPIGNVKQAVARIGLNEIRNISTAFWAMKYFAKASDLIDIKSFWKHSIGVALCTKIIFSKTKLEGISKDDAFTAGIFHDLGILILDQFFPFEYRKIRSLVKSRVHNVYEIERSVLGLSHSEMGAMLLKKWNLPPSIYHATAFHHEPDRCNLIYKPLTQMIHLADSMVSNAGELEPGERLLDGFSHGAWHNLRLNVQDIPQIISEVNHELEGAGLFSSLGLS